MLFDAGILLITLTVGATHSVQVPYGQAWKGEAAIVPSYETCPSREGAEAHEAHSKSRLYEDVKHYSKQECFRRTFHKKKNYTPVYFANKLGNCLDTFALTFSANQWCTPFVGAVSPPTPVIGVHVQLPKALPPTEKALRRCHTLLACTNAVCDHGTPAAFMDAPILRTPLRDILLRKAKPLSSRCAYVPGVDESKKTAAVYMRAGDTIADFLRHYSFSDVKAWMEGWTLEEARRRDIEQVIVFASRGAHVKNSSHVALANRVVADIHEMLRELLVPLPVLLVPEPSSSAQWTQTPDLILRDVACMIDGVDMLVGLPAVSTANQPYSTFFRWMAMLQKNTSNVFASAVIGGGVVITEVLPGVNYKPLFRRADGPYLSFTRTDVPP